MSYEMPRLLRRIFSQVPLLVVIVENGGEGGIRTLGRHLLKTLFCPFYLVRDHREMA